VRAKIFDSLIVEEGVESIERSHHSLETVLVRAEEAALAKGWDIQLIEKPLHGLQNEYIETVMNARKVVREFSDNH